LKEEISEKDRNIDSLNEKIKELQEKIIKEGETAEE